ncbi:MAG: hypothetical protein KAT05_17825 [Spirochaetes bacterium]|nr:hypothetical protein [Spirochaetota bacterium]
MYQIGELITKTLKEKNIGRYELVKRVGYKNTGKGLNKLDDLIRYGICNEFIYTNLPAALDIPEIDVKEAMILTQEEIKKERQTIEKKCFKPHLVIKTENERPNSITMAVITGGFKAHRTIPLADDILDHKYDEKLKIIKDIIKNHYKRKNGISAFFGKILGYIFCEDYDEPPDRRLTFNTEGEIDNSISNKFYRPGPDGEGIFIGGRRVPFIIPFKNI